MATESAFALLKIRWQLVQILTILFTCQIRSLFAGSDFLGVHTCVENKTVAVQVFATNGENASCQCQAAPVSDPNFRDDYTYIPGLGAYKLHTLAKSWNDARKICNEENAHLAIINSKAEEKVMLDMFKKESENIHGTWKKDQAFLGVHDLYKEGEWVTIFGESLYSTGYAEWSSHCWGAQPDNWNNEQHCASLILKCGTMDDISCGTSLAFFCEQPIPCALQASFAAASEETSNLPIDIRQLAN